MKKKKNVCKSGRNRIYRNADVIVVVIIDINHGNNWRHREDGE